MSFPKRINKVFIVFRFLRFFYKVLIKMIPWNGKKVNREFINSISGDWKIFMEKDKSGQIFGDGCRDTSRRQLKSFSVQQFFKNAAEVWASSPHLRSK